MEEEWQSIGRWMHGSTGSLQGKGGCAELWSLQRSKVAGAHHKDCGKGNEGKNSSYGKSRQDSIWVYAGKKNRCSLLYII